MQKYYIYLLFYIIALLSCQQEKRKTNTSPSTNLNYINIKSDNVLIQIPSNTTSALPLIFIIDSHADTNILKTTFNYFKNTNQCILAISLDVKNNTENFLEKIKEEINNIQKKFNISCLIITGFSGGARMAFYYAITNKVDALLLFGAGAEPSLIPKNLNFPIIMITGYKDFNFIETYYSPFSSIVENPNIISIYHKGKHEWPDSLLINEIFSLVLSKFYNKEFTDFLNIPTNIMLDEFKKYETLYKLSNNNQQTYKNKIENIRNSMGFKNEIQQFEQTIYEEISQRAFLLEAIEKKNIDWWKNYYKNLNDSLKSENFINQSYWYRIKGFIGIMVYSKLNNLYNKNEFNYSFKKILEIYKLFEPENKEMKYFYALYLYKTGNYNEAKKILRELINENFSNFNRLKKDFNRLNLDEIK